MAFGSAIDILDIVGCSLKMACCIVALRYKDIVIDAAFQRLVQGNRRTLDRKSALKHGEFSNLLTMNFSSILPRRSKPDASSRWWLADDSAIVETIAI
jgi:hypothetical protein